MTSGSLKTLAISAAIIIFGFGSVFALSNFLERNRVELPQEYEDADLTLEGKRLKGYALGAEGLLADWYWMKSLQYIGDKLVKTEESFINLENLNFLNPRLLYPYLDNATDLDPKFMAAYSYGASVLPAVDPAKAIQLTEKGIANNPEQWRLYHYLGYIHWRLKNYEKAGEIYKKGAGIAGSAQFMQMMAATMQTHGGSRDTARSMYKEMLTGAQDQQTKNNAEFRLQELNSLDEREAIRSVLKKANESSGRCPQSWNEVLPLLRSIKLPGGNDFRIDKSNNLVDPSGAPYILDRERCDVALDRKTTKIPLQ
ncbi:MAG: hypothetical protein H7070_14930 [Saprospiraceae bacterium]|nr:hypothetical protein [Pyrinomonadaceae bacterium]